MDTEKLTKQIENLSITSKSFEELVIASKKKYEKLDSLSTNSDSVGSDYDDSESTRTSNSSSRSSNSSTTNTSSDSSSDDDSFSDSNHTVITRRKKQQKHKKKSSNAIDILLQNDESTDEQLIPRGARQCKPEEQNDKFAKTKPASKQRKPRVKKQTIKQIFEQSKAASNNNQNNSNQESDTNYLAPQCSPQSSSNASYTQSTSTGSISDESKDLSKNIESDPHYLGLQYSPQSLSSMNSLGSPFGTESSYDSSLLPTDGTDLAELYQLDLVGTELTFNMEELLTTTHDVQSDKFVDDDSNLPNLFETLLNSEIPDYETKLTYDEIKHMCHMWTVKLNIDNILRKKDTLIHTLAKSKIYNTDVDELIVNVFNLHNKNVDLPSDEIVSYMIACIKRTENPEKVQLLESLFNQINSDYETPLTLAIRFDRVELLELMFPYANMKALKQPELRTPLQIACYYGSQKCFTFLFQHYYSKPENLDCLLNMDMFGNNCLTLAIIYHDGHTIDNTKVIKALATHSSVNRLKYVDENGNNFAHLLCQNQSFTPNSKITLLKDLRATEADIFEVANQDGKTAWTSYKGNKGSYFESEFRALVLQRKNEIYN